ncbi:MAG: peptidase [Gammaproteobacteria bacterium HGW-Gammaproteobacteria-14]|nr:MAG: peptidase [Gammaproteobacteria bacterium HGW-Gammaproteobacteria-14]
MTYCVAMRLSSGMVFLADSRTNAGVDHIATFRKLHSFCQPGERLIVMMSSGNLATTQSVLSLLRTRLGHDAPNLFNQNSFFEVAELIGATMREVISRDSGKQQSAVDFGCNFIVGGQIRGQDMELYHIYPEGNFIQATTDTPYFQIGEIKYGKPIIDRVINFTTPIEHAVKCALISMDSTIRSNLSVGTPLDLLLYRRDSLNPTEYFDINESHPGFQQLREAWSMGLRQTFSNLPDIEW